MIKVFALFLVLLVSCSQKHTHHQKHHGPHKPGHKNEKYLDPKLDAEQWNKDFQAEDRDTVVHKKAIVNHLPIKTGDAIADVGAGTGMFEKDFSKAVGPRGKVYAIDIAPSFIPFMTERFKKENLKNVEVVQGKLETTTLKDNSVNLVAVIDTYHHFDHPEQMLNDFLRILRPGGHLVIVDFKRSPNAREWIMNHVEKSMEDYIKEISNNGFKFVREEKIPFKESFQLTFKKI